VLAKRKKTRLISIILIAVAINVLIFAVAYPRTLSPFSSTLAHDFSAYYIGAWRLFHNPTKIYYGGSYPGDYPITPSPSIFEYAPSFLLWFSPFLKLSYQDALTAFDLLQVASIFAVAFFVYKIVKGKNALLGAVVAFLVLVQPSTGYYDGYVTGNAHVIQVAFIVGAMYFGFAKKPWFSAILFTLSAFDPRASLIALPLLLWYNRQRLWQFIAGSAVFLAVTNLPFFFYYNIGLTFLHLNVNGRRVLVMWGYDWLSIFAVAVLSLMEIVTILNNRKTLSVCELERTGQRYIDIFQGRAPKDAAKHYTPHRELLTCRGQGLNLRQLGLQPSALPG
jgi:Glycosyltransferase family 87